MKSKVFLTGIFSVLLVFSMVLAGCNYDPPATFSGKYEKTLESTAEFTAKVWFTTTGVGSGPVYPSDDDLTDSTTNFGQYVRGDGETGTLDKDEVGGDKDKFYKVTQSTSGPTNGDWIANTTSGQIYRNVAYTSSNVDRKAAITFTAGAWELTTSNLVYHSNGYDDNTYYVAPPVPTNTHIMDREFRYKGTYTTSRTEAGGDTEVTLQLTHVWGITSTAAGAAPGWLAVRDPVKEKLGFKDGVKGTYVASNDTFKITSDLFNMAFATGAPTYATLTANTLDDIGDLSAAPPSSEIYTLKGETLIYTKD